MDFDEDGGGVDGWEEEDDLFDDLDLNDSNDNGDVKKVIKDDNDIVEGGDGKNDDEDNEDGGDGWDLDDDDILEELSDVDLPKEEKEEGGKQINDESGWGHDDDDIAFDDDLATHTDIEHSNLIIPPASPENNAAKHNTSMGGWSDADLDLDLDQHTHTHDSTDNTRDSIEKDHNMAPHDAAQAHNDDDNVNDDNEDNGWDDHDDDIQIDDHSDDDNNDVKSSSGAPSTVSEEWMARYPHAVNRSNSTEIDFAEEGLAVPLKNIINDQQQQNDDDDENGWDDDALDDDDLFRQDEQETQPHQQNDQHQQEIETSLPSPPQQKTLQRTNTDILNSAEEGKPQTNHTADIQSLPPPPQHQSIHRNTTEVLTSAEEGTPQPISQTQEEAQNVNIAAPPSTAGSILLEGMEAQTLHSTQHTPSGQDMNVTTFDQQQQAVEEESNNDCDENNLQLTDIPTETTSSNLIVDSTMEETQEATKDNLEPIVTVTETEQQTTDATLTLTDNENAVAIVPADDNDDDNNNDEEAIVTIPETEQQTTDASLTPTDIETTVAIVPADNDDDNDKDVQQEQQLASTENDGAIMTNQDIGIALDTAECSCLEQLVEFFDSKGKGLALLQSSPSSNDAIATTTTNGELDNDDTAATATSLAPPHVQIVQNILQNELTKRLLLERQIAALQSTVDNLEAGRDELSALAEARENTLREEHDGTKSQLEEYRLTNETLRSQNDTIKSDLAESQNYVSRLEGEKSSLLQNVEDRRVEVAELRSAAEEAAAAAAKETERLAAEAASLRYDLDAKVVECDQSNLAFEEANKKLLQAETCLSNTTNDNAVEVQRLQRELDGMSESKGEMILQFEQYAAEIKNVRMENEAFKSDFAHAKDDIARLEGERRGLVEQVETQAAQIAEMQSAAKDAATNHAAILSEKDARIAELRSAAEKDATAAAEAMSVREEEAGESIRLLKDEVQSLSRSRDELEHQSNCYKARCDDLYTEGEADRSDLTGARILIQEMKNEKEDFLKQVQDYESQISELRLACNATSTDTASGISVESGESDVEAHSLRRQLESMTSQCEETKTTLEEAQKKLIETEGRLFTLTKESARNDQKTQKQMKDLKEEIESLKEEREKLILAKEEEIESYRTREDGMNQKDESISEELALLKQDKDSMIKRISTYEEDNKNLQSQVDELRKENDELFADCEMKDVKCNELEQHIAFMKEEEAQLAMEKLNNDGVIGQLRTNLDQLSKKYNELLIQKNELESLCNEMKDKIAPNDAHTQESEGDTTFIHLQSERDCLMSEKEGLVTRCNELESFVDRLNSEMQEKDVAVQTIQGELNSATHDFSSQKSELQDRYLQLEEKAKKAEAALAEQQKKIQHSEDALHHVREELISLSALRDQIHSEKNEISSTCTELEMKLKNLEEQKQTHMEEIESVRGKEQALQNEVERLEADNEELLVQLGLLRQLQQQDREVYETNFSELRVQVESKQSEIIQLKGLLGEAEKAKLETSGVNDNDSELMEKVSALTISNSGLQKAVGGLQEERTKLQKEIDNMAQTISEQERQIDSLYEEKQNLMEKIDDLELTNSLLENESANAGISPEQQQIINELEDRCQKSEGLCQQKDEELKTLADENMMLKQETGSIQVQVQELTQLCASRAEELREKDSVIRLLKQNEISTGDNARSEFLQMREQLETRHQQETERHMNKIYEMEQALALSGETIKNHEDQIHSMKEVYGEVKEQLRAKQEQVASMEVALLNSELSLDAQRQESAEIERCKQYINELEHRLSKKDEVLMDLDVQRKSAEARLMRVSAEFEVEKKKEHSVDVDAKIKELVQDLSNKYKELSAANSHIASLEEGVKTKEKELETMKKKLISLEEDLRRSKSNMEENLQNYNNTTETMKTEMAKKEKDIDALKSEIVALADALKICQDNLSASLDDSNRLRDELEEAKNNQIQTTQDATAGVLGGVSSKEEAESLDFMRKQIIALALALEQSELKRAEALDRVMKERKSNADNLRRLGESVKRFYSTVSCGDSS